MNGALNFDLLMSTNMANSLPYKSAKISLSILTVYAAILDVLTNTYLEENNIYSSPNSTRFTTAFLKGNWKQPQTIFMATIILSMQLGCMCTPRVPHGRRPLAWH